mgnify:CR=1 FL=1
MGHTDKRDFAEHLGFINILLNLSPAKIIMDESRWAVPYYFAYSNDPNEESYYRRTLNEQYRIRHNFKRSDVNS